MRDGKGWDPLPGEDISSEEWQDARHWVGLYTDLLRFKAGLRDRIRRNMPKLEPEAQRKATRDIAIIEGQMAGHQHRLALWYQRSWELRGVWIDRENGVVRHRDKEASITKRERQLLQFLLDHPNRFYPARQIRNQAWGEPGLTPGAVRTYIQRVREILRRLEIPCDIVNSRGQGYMLDLPDE